MRMTSGVVATASKRDTRAAIAGGLAAQLLGGLAVDGRHRRQREVELPVRVHAPGPQLVAGRLARGEVRRVGRRRGEGRVEPGDERPEVRGDLRRPLEAHGRRAPRRGPRGTPRSSRTRPPRPRRTPGASRPSTAPLSRVTTSAQPASRGTPGNRGLLGEVRGELEVRVEARLDPAVALEQQPVAQHDRGVRLVAPERALLRRARRVRGSPPHASAKPGDGRQTSAAATWPDAPAADPPAAFAAPAGSPSRVSAAIVRPSAIATASARQAPSPSAASRHPPSARDERDRVPVQPLPGSPRRTSTSASTASSDERERVRERRRDGRLALGGVPAAGGEDLEVERPDRGRDRGAVDGHGNRRSRRTGRRLRSCGIGPAGRSDARVDRDVLDDRVVLERVLGAVLAPARLLDAAVRGLGRRA